MDSIASIIPKAIKKAGIEGRIAATQVLDLFEKNKESFLQPVLASKVRAAYFQNHVLNIASLSTEASRELIFREYGIVAFINKKLGMRVVEKIVVIV
jgi:hypothetical protein